MTHKRAVFKFADVRAPQRVGGHSDGPAVRVPSRVPGMNPEGPIGPGTQPGVLGFAGGASAAPADRVTRQL